MPPRSISSEPTDAASTALASLRSSPLPRLLNVMVFADESLAAYPLAPAGLVHIGRADDAEIRIDGPRVSRRHALLHLGAEIEVEDLGSANGTRVGTRTLKRGERATLKAGDSFEVGSATLVLQEELAGAPRRPRRLVTHGYLESRLEEECDKRAATSLARVSLRGAANRRQVVAALEELLAPGDLLGAHSPGEYEVVVMGREPETVAAAFAALSSRLEGLGTPIEVRLAHFPRDAENAAGLIAVAAGGANDAPDPQPVVKSPAMKKLFALAARVARGDLPLLVLGETGVGKEVLAEAIHRASGRAAKPLVTVHVGGLSESLLESELFGHAKGAFTGASHAKEGLLETAPGGTVFLDEIGELSPNAQVRLLRVLERKENTRVGETRARPLDVRFIAATHRNLPAEIAAGRFRQDLFFRLNGMTLEIPPLRARPEDILALAEHFAVKAVRQLGLEPKRFATEFSDALLRFDWPGNVRELRNTMERAVLLAEGNTLGLETLPIDRMSAATSPGEAKPLPTKEAEAERARILSALDSCAGNQKVAAERLGISRRTLLNRLDHLDIPRPRKHR